jgi:hypothetical protein
MGAPGSEIPVVIRMMVDSGAQSSIISFEMAANLNLPLEPDFLVEVCGVGGVAEAPGYYVDYVQINALGGALRFSRIPFVVIDLPSPEGGIMDGILGMNFFWNRNVVIEPSLDASSFFSVSDPIPFAFGDHNADRNVDRADAAAVLACVTGPNAITPSPECDHLDADLDGDIDLLDMRRFQLCFSGAGMIADANCGE